MQTRSNSGFTFIVDLVVQGDGATAPLDGPTGLFLCASIQWNTLPFTSDAAFQLQGKNKLIIFLGSADGKRGKSKAATHGSILLQTQGHLMQRGEGGMCR